MVTFTSQVGEILDRIQENAIAIDEERLYWKGVAEVAATQADELEQQVRNLTRSCDELRRMYHQSEQARQEEAVFPRLIDRSMEMIDEKNRQVERLTATVNEYANENERLKQVAHQNAVAADGFTRENEELKDVLVIAKFVATVQQRKINALHGALYDAVYGYGIECNCGTECDYTCSRGRAIEALVIAEWS
jgi:methyl-accepting chemotaxis protein